MDFWKALLLLSQAAVDLSPTPVVGDGLTVLDVAIPLIKEFEGCHRKKSDGLYHAYLDGVGVWTIGWGTTLLNPDRKVRSTDILAKEECDRLFMDQLEDYYLAVIEKRIPYWSSMSVYQKAALLSFAYNLGAHFYGNPGFDTLTRVLKNKEWEKVPEVLKMYRNPGSSVEEGLLRRRVAEGKMWSKGLMV